MLQFDSVQKHYGSFLALDVQSLSLNDGVYWLHGENGSGKSTFLKMIGGLHPFEGNISLDNCSIKKNRVSFLQQVNYAEAETLYPLFLTAKELVHLYCDTKNSTEQKALYLLEQLHIIDVYQKPVGSYSSGMLKKLSIALAFIGNPKWILLDEPLITVDAEAVEVICSWVNRMHSEDGISFIITSHQPFHSGQLNITQTLSAVNQTIHLNHA
jgi:ABC-2 type transport system ATP-binding protein